MKIICLLQKKMRRNILQVTNKIIQQMRKVQEIVISIIILFAVCLTGNAQIDKDDSILIKKIIEKTRLKDENNVYVLRETSVVYKNWLERYYNYRFKGKSSFVFAGFVGDSDSLVLYGKNSMRQKKFDSLWKSKYHLLDTIINKEDVEYMLARKDTISWLNSEVGNNVILKKTKTYYDVNHIARPLYSVDKKYAIIPDASDKSYLVVYIYVKVGSDWQFLGAIENISYLFS